MKNSKSANSESNDGLIVSASSDLVGLPDDRSAPLEEIILRSLEYLAEPVALISLEPRPGEERDFPIAPGVSMRMCWCPPGNFILGSPASEEGRHPDEEQVRVTLRSGFWMGKTTVTQAQWQAVMGSCPSRFQGAELPVETISWNEAQAFVTKINSKFELFEQGKFLLPTEAQWEYAARAGENGPYPGGVLDQIAWYSGNSENQTHSVATKKPNEWGLHDMIGNVWEWCADWYGFQTLGGSDPIGPPSGILRVFRGGSWNVDATNSRVAYRGFIRTPYQCNYFGLRVARIEKSNLEKITKKSFMPERLSEHQ